MKFYMVYVEGKSSPTKKHASYNSAANEALRLKKTQTYGTKVYILEATRIVVDAEPFVQSTDYYTGE